MRTIVHLGQHKTSTTSIQMYLSEKGDDLRERGLYVPLPGDIHALLNVYSLHRRRLSPVKEDLKKQRGLLFFWLLGKRLRAGIARHYRQAAAAGCRDVIWSNEGLYLLNSAVEYGKLVRLLAPYSEKIVAVCCFRDVASYRSSYMAQLKKEGRSYSNEKDSYRYVKEDSWLFDFERKREQLQGAFDELIEFTYDPQDNVGRFFEMIGYPAEGTATYRHNVTA